MRERGLLPLEEAVRLMTDVPARSRPACAAVSPRACTPTSSCSTPTRRTGPAVARFDLPGGGERLFAEARGIDHVFVNGSEVVIADVHDTGLISRARSCGPGVDTDTVSVR